MVMLLLSNRTGENLKSDMAEICLVFLLFLLIAISCCAFLSLLHYLDVILFLLA